MALSIGVRTGQVLQIGDTKVTMTSVGPGEIMRMAVGEKAIPFIISSQNRVEILPKVYVSIGRGASANPGPRLCFEASRDIPIIRLT